MNTQGTRWRGKLPIPEKAHPLVRQMFEIMNEEQTVISEVAPRAGLKRDTISNWRYVCAPYLDNFEAALNSLGYELCIREIGGKIRRRAEAA